MFFVARSQPSGRKFTTDTIPAFLTEDYSLSIGLGEVPKNVFDHLLKCCKPCAGLGVQFVGVTLGIAFPVGLAILRLSVSSTALTWYEMNSVCMIRTS